jgi:hypothetical protein
MFQRVLEMEKIFFVSIFLAGAVEAQTDPRAK